LLHEIEHGQEEFRLLRARNRITLFKDEARHGVDANAPRRTVFGEHVGEPVVASKEASRLGAIEALAHRDFNKPRGVAHIDAFDEIGPEQRLDEPVGAPSALGASHQAVRVLRVGSRHDALERKRDADRGARFARALIDSLRVMRAAELEREVFVPRHTVGRHVGIELEWPPGNLGFDVRPLRQRALEPALADEAPGTDHVEHDIDVHEGSLALARRGRRDIITVMSIYDAPHLVRSPANFVALSPLSFLARSASVHPGKVAVVHGGRSFTYREFYARCCRLASALRRRGVGLGDTVSVMAPNVPALLEAHFGVAMAGAVLNALNYRLDARTIAFILGHAESKVLVTDREYSGVIAEALKERRPPTVIDIDDPLHEGGTLVGEMDYEAFLATGNADDPWQPPQDEWQAISLNYTSGTTGNPKGVVYHHRGAFLNALGNVIAFGLSPRTVYLWTLPMFHCNGWTYPWAVTAVAGTHVCLRRVEPKEIFPAIDTHGVTHMCGAPIVLNMLVHAPDAVKRHFARTIEIATGGASPPSTVIANMERMGFRVTHLYGLTESYGPATLCAWQEEWDALPLEARAGKMARQGVAYPTLAGVRVVDPATMRDTPSDGASMGELMLRSNTLMKGYLKNPAATGEAFAGGWFHSGDLGVMHQDGYVEIKDRSKDIIISGGENISSLEIEEVLYRHPAVMEAAVVARPDPHWGESPCAFVTLKPGDEASADAIIAFCRDNLAHYKAPKSVVFGPLPKTSTGKIQKYVLRAHAAKLKD
jgi:fatty-acyl-CoA synthase